MKHKNFTLGVFVRGVFVLGDFCPRFFVGGICPGRFVLEPLKSKQQFYNFEKSAIFALSLKQMSSSSFHMFIYARSEQCDIIGGSTYLLTI